MLLVFCCLYFFPLFPITLFYFFVYAAGEVHKQMEEEKFEASLYVGRLEQVIIVFYWHQEIHL